MSETKKGGVFWITGLPGSGKSTIGRLLFERLKKQKDNVVFLDGDDLRIALSIKENYSYEERKKISFTYCRLCKMLAEQGIDVVIATVSLFHECHEWNRAHQPRYYECFLQVPMAILEKRNQKNLFSGEAANVVGIDVLFEAPKKPHMILENHGEVSPKEAEEELYQCIISYL